VIRDARIVPFVNIKIFIWGSTLYFTHITSLTGFCSYLRMMVGIFASISYMPYVRLTTKLPYHHYAA
jgi:hypothetical protein